MKTNRHLQTSATEALKGYSRSTARTSPYRFVNPQVETAR